RRSGPQKGEVEREDCRECALAGDILIPLDFVNERFVKAEDVPIQVLLPSITPATPSTSSEHNETELEGGTKRLAEIIGEGVGWKVVLDHEAKRHVIVGEREDGPNYTHWVKWDYYYYGNRCGAYLQMPEPVDYKLPAAVTITSATSPDGTVYRVDGLRVFVTPTVKESLQVDPLSWDANPPMVGDFVQDKDGHRMMITTQYSDGKVVVGEYDSDPIELSRDELKQKGYVRLILSQLHKEAGR
ncbi:MAG: hypothetical protein GXY83_25225, partial [Rhodopirellula sp.]|nr:hypothetical protein [Rhodopirellula sp.]